MEADTNIDEENQDSLQMIKTSCDKATFIINDLLETAHNDLGSEFDLEETELNKFLLLITDEWLKNKNSNVKILYFGSKKPVYAHVNKEKMQRVMDNLISNAVKFSEESGYVEIFLRTAGDWVIIEVKDAGIGIPQTILPFIFYRFFKSEPQRAKGPGVYRPRLKHCTPDCDETRG